MDGKNFDLLRVFFTVLKSCSREEEEEGRREEGSKTVEPKPETHLRLLQELKSPLKGAVKASVCACVHATCNVHEPQGIKACPQCAVCNQCFSVCHLPSQV